MKQQTWPRSVRGLSFTLLRTKFPLKVPSGCQDVTELDKVPLHEILALNQVIFGREILHAVLLRTQAVLLQYHHLSCRRHGAVWVGTVQEGSPRILQGAQVRVQVSELHVAVGAAAAVAPDRVGAHVQHLVLLVHQKLVGVLGGPHPLRSVPFDVDGPEGPHRPREVSGCMVILMVMGLMTLRVLLVIAPSWPPSTPSCPAPLLAPPAAFGPAVLPAAGRVPLRRPFALLLLLLLLQTAPPAHHLCEHLSCLSCSRLPFSLLLCLTSSSWLGWPHTTTTTKRGWFLAQITKWPSSPFESTFSLSCRFFSWPLALADASPALPPLAAAACLLGLLPVTPSYVCLNISSSPLWKS